MAAVDLTGTQPVWPGEARDLWRDCVTAASRKESHWRVPVPQGDELLREQLAQAIGADPARITVTAGVRATALTYARRAADIVVERPSFPGVLHVLAGAGARVSRAGWDELLSGELPGQAVIWVTSPARNPDGRTLSDSEEALLRQRIEAGHRVVVNQAYSWFASCPAPRPEFDTLGTLHKLAGHGARLGWVHSADYFDIAVPELLGSTPPPVWQHAWGLFLQAGGLALLETGCVAPAMAAARAFREMAERLGWSPQFTGPHLLLQTAPSIGAGDAVSLLSERGFAVSDAASFESTHPAVRVSFLSATPQAAAAFAEVAVHSGLFAVPSAAGVP